MKFNKNMLPADVDKVIHYLKVGLNRYNLPSILIPFDTYSNFNKELQVSLNGTTLYFGFNELSTDWFFKYGDLSVIRSYQITDIWISDTEKEILINDIIKIDFCA